MWKGNIWAPFFCCWFVDLFLTFVLCCFFFLSMLVNCKVLDWLTLRLVSLIYPENRKNAGGNRTGQVQVRVQHISPTYSGRTFSSCEERTVSGNAGHRLLWQAHRRLLTRHQLYSGLHPVSHRWPSFQSSIFLPPASACQNSILEGQTQLPVSSGNSRRGVLGVISLAYFCSTFPCNVPHVMSWTVGHGTFLNHSKKCW